MNKVQYQPGWCDQWAHRYFYDAENRLTEVQTSGDGYIWEKEAKYEYYLHGPLARTILGQQQVQGVDYAYTLQGWLKGVNSTGATATYDIGGDGKVSTLNQYVGRDALGFNLNYFLGDYKPVNVGAASTFPAYKWSGGGLPDTAYRPLYNGNISSMATHIRMFDAMGHVPILYNFKYDQLNRLVKQDAYFNFNAGTNTYGTNWAWDQTFHEEMAYDANGNFQSAVRHAIGANSRMDELTYHYYAGTNQLRRVTDNIDSTKYGSNAWETIQDLDTQPHDTNYVYDAIGNLVLDKKEGITNIKWNVYGKIMEITRNVTARNNVVKLVYNYDAQGNRIGKVEYLNAGTRNYTWYVRDAQGNLISTYAAVDNTSAAPNDLDGLQLSRTERQLYGSSRLGVIDYGSSVDGGPGNSQFFSGGTYDRGRRQYELTNHLGNVLTTISDNKIGVYSNGSLTLPNDTIVAVVDYYEPHMVNATDYYAFGMPSRVASSATGAGYRFGFNGKENDNEVKGFGNQQDYGMRIYDNRVGRFLSVDPLQKTYPELTPYQFSSNSPIANIDLDGLERIHYTLTYNAGKPVLTPTGQVDTKGGFLNMIKYDRQDVIHYDNETFYFHYDNKEDVKVQNIPEWNYGNYNQNQLQDFLADPASFWSEEDNRRYVAVKTAESATSSMAMMSSGRARSKMSYRPKLNIKAGTNAAINNQATRANSGNVEAEESNTATIYRTQGGALPNASQQRVFIGRDGRVRVEGDQMLYITINDKDHQVYFYGKRGGSEKGAYIISFKIPQSLADEIKKSAVPQAQGKAFPNKPQISDPTKSKGAYGLPIEYIKKIQEQAIPGSGQIQTPKE